LKPYKYVNKKVLGFRVYRFYIEGDSKSKESKGLRV
jgi:hypothetical protein